MTRRSKTEISRTLHGHLVLALLLGASLGGVAWGQEVKESKPGAPPSSVDETKEEESTPLEPSPAGVEIDKAQATLELNRETMVLEDGTSLAYDRGLARVPLRRGAPDSAKIGVEFFRFSRQPEAPKDVPPIFILRGGPGFQGLAPLLERPGFYENRLAPYTEITDVVVPGQRGFGTSNATPCDPMQELSIDEALDREARENAVREATAACRKKWQDQGLDLPAFNVLEAAADVVDIARALGYERIQLWGISFGSHWGMTLIRHHPELISRATFGGLEGPDHTYDMPSGVLAAFERIAASAEASKELGPLIPEGGLLAAYAELIARADEEPIEVELGLGGVGEQRKTVTVHLDGETLRYGLGASRRFTSFRFRMPGWPLALLAAQSGDLEMTTGTLVASLRDTEISDAAFFQLDCGSGISEERGRRLRQDPAAELIGPIWLGYDVGCEAWDADLGESFRSPFETDVPTLLVQGNWDTSTPYENALEVRPFFNEHRFVHVEGGSHGALREAMEDVEGFRESVETWLRTGSFADIPESVELPPMTWRAP